jgi:hypothetical protein
MRAVRVAVALSALIAFAAPAAACINDSESEKAEKEFKSRYLRQPVPPAAAPEYREAEPAGPSFAWGGTAGGLALLAGAVAVGARGPRRAS